MKKIFVVIITGLFLITGFGLTAQPRGNGNGPRQEFRTYMQNNIQPELLKQKKAFMDALTKTETEELLKMKEEQEAIRGNMQGQVTPENRDNIREAHFSAFKVRLDKIVDAHPDLKKQYITEMTQNKEKWIKDLEAIRVKNNMPERGQKPMMMMDKLTDPAFILMWNPNNGNRNMGMRQMRGQHGGKNCQQMNRGQQMNKHRQMGMRKNNGMMPPRDKAMEPGIHVFPQPATATTIIKISGILNQDVKAGVYNSKGKKIKKLYNGEASMPMLDYTLDVSKWDAGIYTVKVTFGERNMSMDFKVKE